MAIFFLKAAAFLVLLVLAIADGSFAVNAIRGVAKTKEVSVALRATVIMLLAACALLIAGLLLAAGEALK